MGLYTTKNEFWLLYFFRGCGGTRLSGVKSNPSLTPACTIGQKRFVTLFRNLRTVDYVYKLWWTKCSEKCDKTFSGRLYHDRLGWVPNWLQNLPIILIAGTSNFPRWETYLFFHSFIGLQEIWHICTDTSYYMLFFTKISRGKHQNYFYVIS